MNKEFNKIFKEIPDFLSILGFVDAYLDKDNSEWVIEFMPSTKLTHSNGTIIQGGFVSGMIDASMSQFIIHCTARLKVDRWMPANIHKIIVAHPTFIHRVGGTWRKPQNK